MRLTTRQQAMASNRQPRFDVHGIVLLDKPEGMTSNQACQQIKGLFRARKVGHTGSLDPFATGLLPVCMGEATKVSGYLLDADKRYQARLKLGQATQTGDTEGEVVNEAEVPELEENQIRTVLEGFLGAQKQVPPMYSALKHKGKPLYEYARAGEEVERPARPVTIHSLELDEWTESEISFSVHCSKGTYVRTLAEDIAKKLGTVGHLVALRRTAAGPFDVADTHTIEALDELKASGKSLSLCLLPLEDGLPDWPQAAISGEAMQKFQYGNPVPYTKLGEAVEEVLVFNLQHQVLGLGKIEDSMLKPKRVFRLD